MYKSRSANIIASAIKESDIEVHSEAHDSIPGMKKVASTTLGKLNRAVKNARRDVDEA